MRLERVWALALPRLHRNVVLILVKHLVTKAFTFFRETVTIRRS